MPIDTWIKIWRGGFAIAFFGAAQFLLCCLVAVIIYPGGSMINEHSDGYDLSENYINDLGREMTYAGQSNAKCSRLFNSSLILFGVCTLPFYVFMPTHAYDMVGWLTVASVLGVISCIAVMLIGANPIDSAPLTHGAAAFVWLVSIFLCAGIHAICMLNSKEDISIWMSLISVAVAMFATAYFYHGSQTAAAIVFQRDIPLKSVLLQKLFGIMTLIWLFTFSAKLLLTTDFSEYYDRNIAKETETYLNDLSGRTLKGRHQDDESEDAWIPRRK